MQLILAVVHRAVTKCNDKDRVCVSVLSHRWLCHTYGKRAQVRVQVWLSCDCLAMAVHEGLGMLV